MKHLWNRGRARPGALAPLAAVLMVPVLGMCAYSIDAGYIVLVQSDLQNTADAAALAGAEQLQELYVKFTLPGLTPDQQQSILTAATTSVAPSGTYGTTNYVPGSPTWTAQYFASQNKAGGVYISVPDSDVAFGYTDANGNYTGYDGTTFPNTITVVTRRDTTANNPIDLFFGPVFNRSQQSLSATAQATIYAGNTSSLQAISGVDAHILPVALDINIWRNFYATGLSPDGLKHFYPLNGLPEIKVYPTNTNTPGSFALVDVGPASTKTPTFRSWIDNGETPNDITYLLGAGLLPVSPTATQPWLVGPGITNTLLSNFQGQMGAPNLIPLFVPYQTSPSYVAAANQGSNATYAIAGFVSVTVSEANSNGNANLTIAIQPMAIVDPTAVIEPMPVGGGSSWFSTKTTIIPDTTFISAKLTK
jgi:hypothetical protein